MNDIVIIGAGPCGLSAAIAARRAGLSALIIEKGALTNTIVGYPLETSFFSTAPNLTIGGIPWTAPNPHPTRIEALAYYRAVAEDQAIAIKLYETATSIERHGDPLGDGSFVVATARPDGATAAYPARAVIAATGSYDTPNQLDAPGADHPKVRHYYREGHPFYRQRVAVVGGGNSAAEAALDLFYHGAEVTLIHQFAGFDPRVKPWVLADLEAWIKAGRISARWQSRIARIDTESLLIANTAGETATIANDWVFALIGYRPDTAMLAAAGVHIGDDAVPEYDRETMETNVPGLFIAGVLAAGSAANKIFIENGRDHGPRIVATLTQRWSEGGR